MFRRGVGTMVLTERMQALGDHARSSHQRLIAERRQEMNQERDQENRGQGVRDQQSREPDFFAAGKSAAGERGETMMLATTELIPSPPEASPADDVIIIETIETFLAAEEAVPEPAVPKNDNASAPEPAVAQGAGSGSAASAPAARESLKNQEKDGDLAARRAIIHEWQNWAALNPDELADPNVATYFFRHLEAKRPRLLDFPAENKMLAVRTWLLSERCIKA
jgi:hypothetical protein